MAVQRLLPPLPGPPTPIQFPSITRDVLASGLRVWSLPWKSVPVVTAALVIDAGSSSDPAHQWGLASLSADLLDEGAGGRDAVQLSDAFARLGTHLDIDVGQDTTVLSFTTLARNFDAALALVADIVIRPHHALVDLERIRELRISRLKQLRSSPTAVADRAFLGAVFGAHPYGHGTMGTIATLETIALEDVRRFSSSLHVPDRALLVVAGDVPAEQVAAASQVHFGEWASTGAAAIPTAAPGGGLAATNWLLVDRPDAQQSELRIGHLGPRRDASAYHALATLNSALGGQFTSRINQLLRETKGFTYGARTTFDFRRTCSTFSCDTSVQTNSTAEAVADVLEAFEAVRSTRPIAGDELDRAKNSLTRGYARHFETAAHLVRAAVELAKFDLPDDAFDRFVPAVAALVEDDVISAAREVIHPDQSVGVIVGDARRIKSDLDRLGKSIVETKPEF
jgi:zinc protease